MKHLLVVIASVSLFVSARAASAQPGITPSSSQPGAADPAASGGGAAPATPSGAAGPSVERPAEAPGPALARAALLEYRDSVIFFSEEEWAALSIHHHRRTTFGTVRIQRELHAMRGDRRENIDGAAFYEAVGRPDLATSYRRRRIVRYSALATISLSIIATTGLGIKSMLSSPLPTDAPRTQYFAERESAAYLRGAAVSAGVGLVGLVVFAIVDREPVSDSGRRQLALQYNRALRERLGIPEPRDVGLGAYLDRSGGGLALSGRF